MTQSKQIIFVNLLLLGAVVGLAFKLAADWRSAAVHQLPVGTASTALGSSYTLPGATALVAGSQVITRNPFSADRNSIVEVAKAVESGPPPVLPVVVGTMRLGGGYEALMAENAQTASSTFKQVKTGAVVGGYKVVEISDDEVVVELNGERTTINVYLSASGIARTSARTVPAAESGPAAPRIESAGSQPATPSPQVSTAAAPVAAPVQLPSPDPMLKITIEGNRRRYERTTMFGPDVWYEDIK
jgi:hypothetical protein